MKLIASVFIEIQTGFPFQSKYDVRIWNDKKLSKLNASQTGKLMGCHQPIYLTWSFQGANEKAQKAWRSIPLVFPAVNRAVRGKICDKLKIRLEHLNNQLRSEKLGEGLNTIIIPE